MKTVGIIAEYNPFHNGHLYHLNKIKEEFPNHLIVLILSGNYTQRGELSIIDKYSKTKIALHYGIDLVVELPYNFATQCADVFAQGSIELLNLLNVENLVFGSESNNLEKLIEKAKIDIDNNEDIKIELDKGFSYPKALGNVLNKITNSSIDTPNDILGVCYIREIIKNDYNIKPHTIQRTNDYHDLDSNDYIISATNIRKKLDNNEDISKYVPSEVINYNLFSNIDRFDILKYNIISNINKLDEFLLVDEGLSNRIKKYIFEVNTYQELIDKLKTKRYTYKTITRALCHILCNYKKIDKDDQVNYIRVLGFNSLGQEHLNSIKKKTDKKIITKFSDYETKYQDLENRLNYIYYLDYNFSELKNKVIIKK